MIQLKYGEDVYFTRGKTNVFHICKENFPSLNSVWDKEGHSLNFPLDTYWTCCGQILVWRDRMKVKNPDTLKVTYEPSNVCTKCEIIFQTWLQKQSQERSKEA